MFANMTSSLDFHSKALVLRAERQRVIASNIANADTPGYVARELDFRQAMSQATGNASTPPLRSTGQAHARHLPLNPASGELGQNNTLIYATAAQPSMDGNSVDMDRERGSFVDNAIRYESTLRFINGTSKTLLSAIQGQ